MRKLKLFSLLCLLMVGVGHVWGGTYTYDFTKGTQTTYWTSDNNNTSVGTANIESFYYMQSGYSGHHFTAGNGSTTTHNHKFVTNNNQQCFFLGKTGEYLVLPTYSNEKITAVRVTTRDNYGSSSAGVNIFSGDDAASTASTALTSGHDFAIGATYQATELKVKLTSNHNAAITEIVITTESSGSTPQPTVSSDPTSWDFGAVATDASASKVFSVSGSNLTAGTLTLTAPSGYSVSPASISVASAGGLDATNVTVSKNTSIAGTYNGNLTISGCGLESAVNVALSMEVKAKHTVTWNNNGSTSTSQVIDGAKPVFPATPDACDAASTTFIGWATAPWTGKLENLDDKTVYTKAADMPAVTAAVTYYAVFAKSSGSSAFDGEHGGTFKIYAQVGEDKYYALGTVVSSKINSTDDAAEAADFEIEAVTGGFTIKSGTNYITYAGSSTNLGTSTDGYVWTIEEGTYGSWRVNSGTSGRALIYRAGTTNKFGGYATSNVNGTEYFDVEIAGAGSVSDYMTTCCTKRAITIASGIENGTVSADPTSACEGATVTLTFTPAGGYHLDSWSVNSVAQDVNDNTFTMPDEAVTVSATFVHDDCTNLLAPTLDGVTKTYNSATIAWNTVTDAVAYAVSVVKDGESEPVFSGNVDALSKALADLEPETQYNYTIMAIGDGTVKCADGNGVLAGNFTTDPLPTAHLTLKDPSGTHASSGDYAILTPFNLPTTAAACSKAFVGWTSKSDFADGDQSLASYYAKGASFTFDDETDATLYAVYADGGPTNGTITKTMSEIVSENNYTVSSGTNVTMHTELALNSDITLSTTGSANCGSFWGTSPNHEWRLYQNKSGNAIVTAASGCTLTSVKFTFSESNTGALLNGSDAMTSGTAVSASGSSATYTVGNSGDATNGQIRITAVEVKYTKAGSYSNYSTTCVEAPTAEPASASIEVAAAGGNGTLNVTYENVNLANVAVALYNNAACTEAFDGGWLTASIAGDDKHIAYTAQENTSYAARTAYIKLTAPETNGAADPAVVVIPVTQAKYIPVFASLAALVEANLSSGTDVTVSFANEVITNDQTISGPKRAGVYLTTTAGSNAIEIFYNKGTTVVPAGWAIGGSLSATAKTFTWTLFNSQWELIPLGNDWTWDNGDLVYTAPKEVSSVVITGAPSKTEYVDGELFKPAGLTVTVNYTVGDPEVNPVGVTFVCTPARVVKSDDPVSVSVIATFNEVPSEAFPVNVTVGDIQKKTVEEFIAAGNADMRCYLEGIVSDIETGAKLKYGNFNLTDASGTIYVYGCLTSEGVAEKFDELGVANGDKIKVIAEDYDYYNTKHEAKNVQFVSKKSPATMTFSPMALEFGDVETMAPASITLADASDIVYSIKEGSDDCVTISDDQITAKSVAGTATIVATLAETPEYVGATVEFVVTVTAPITKYAISFDDNGADGGEAPEDIANQAENAEVTLPANTWTKEGYKFDGWKVINNTTSAEVPVAEGKFAMPASAVTIQAQWAEIPSWAYVYDNNVEVVHGGTSGEDNATISISDTEYKLVKAGSGSKTGTIKVTVPAGATDLHFHAFTWNGTTAKIQIAGVTNPSISEFDLAAEAGASGSGTAFTLQGVPVDQYYHVSFDAVAAETEITFSKAEGSADNRFFFYGVNQVGGNFGSYQRPTTSGNYGTICLPYAGTISGATLFEIAGYDGSMILCDEITDGKMKAGRPYIFKAAASQLTVDYSANIKTAAGSHNGLYGFYNLEDMATDDADQMALTQDAGNYILYSNAYWLVSGREAFIYNFRAYIKLGEIENAGEPAPGRRRVAMAVHGEQVVTDIDAINASEKPMKLMIDGQLFILRGEKMFDATGRLVK